MILFFGFSLGSRAQSDTLGNTLSFGLNYLLHGEVCGGGLPRDLDGYDDTDDRSSFLLGRMRLNVDYERKPVGGSSFIQQIGVQAHAVLQNKYIWGNQNNQALNLYEGWVKLSVPFGLFAQMGRVALSYDDERIIGTNDFATTSLSHDVAILGYEGYGHKFHAILAYNQNGSNVYKNTYYDPNSGAQYYKTMHTFWYHYDVPKFPLGVSLLYMNIGMQAGEINNTNNPPRTVFQQMYGGYLNFHPKFLTLEGSYYRQGGKMVNDYMQEAPIEAWMASVKATVRPSKYVDFELGYDYLSGDDYVPVIKKGMLGMTAHSLPKGFCPLYGSRSKFYGILDYFYESAYIYGFTPGLQNSFVGVYVNPTSKLRCGATYHYLATATRLNKLDYNLGHSLEFNLSYRIAKDISFMAGYTQMMGSETMNQLKQESGSRQARWGWFSLVVSPSLFTTKW